MTRAAPNKVVEGGGRRAIAWKDLVLSDRERAALTTVGKSWLGRMQQEHLAVGAFALLSTRLAAEGVRPALLLSMVTRASNDEGTSLRHQCDNWRDSAAERRCRFPQVYTGCQTVPPANASSSRRTLLHVVEMCCWSETFTGAYLTEMLSRTSHPVVRSVIESLLEDEIDHGRVGWAYLAARVRQGRVDGLSEALPEMAERTMRSAMRNVESPAPSDDPALEQFGFLGPRARKRVFQETLRDVILPGFEVAGVCTRPLRDAATAKEYL